MRRKTILLLLSFIIIFSYSCTFESGKNIQEEGYVEYDIVYLKNDLKNVQEFQLPKKMKLQFSPRYIKNSIDGFAGIISIKNISDLKKDTVTTMLKFFNYKYYYTNNKGETPCCFEITETPDIEFTDDTIILAGLKCYKAKIIFPSGKAGHDIYYTREIKANNVNKNTAYSEIPGILMEFQMNLSGLTMLFKATKVEQCAIDKKEFTIDKGYKKIPREEMVKIINQLLE